MIEVSRDRTTLPDGRSAGLFRLSAPGGIAVTIAELGATIMRIDAPDGDGRLANTILGHDDLADYPVAGGPGGNHYFGATCGRFANRIGGAAFTLDGVRHALDANEPPNQLHGGRDGFSHRLWRGETLDDGVRLALTSAHGDQGYPGTLTVTATMRLVAHDTLSIVYEARTDRPTHVNIVSHPYFNLHGDGRGDILDHRLRIAAQAVLPIDAASIPLGPPRPVAGTPFDFRAMRTVGTAIGAVDPQIDRGDGYNHAYVLDGHGLREVAWLAAGGRTLTIATDQPSLQFYSGNALPVRRQALCLEAQGFPDAPNRPDFPSTRLDPGDVYRSTLRLRFGTQAR